MNKAGDLFNSLSPLTKSKEPLDSTNNQSTSEQNNDPTEKTNNVQHNDPLNKDNGSITKSNESSKLFPEGGSPKTIEEKVE
jgi:hypothetical protein